MSRVCPVTGKGPISGNNRSHSLRATRRKWNTNLQTRTVLVDGKKHAFVCLLVLIEPSIKQASNKLLLN